MRCVDLLIPGENIADYEVGMTGPSSLALVGRSRPDLRQMIAAEEGALVRLHAHGLVAVEIEADDRQATEGDCCVTALRPLTLGPTPVGFVSGC